MVRRFAIAKRLGIQLAKRSLPTAVKLATAGLLDLDNITEEALASLAEDSAEDAIKQHDEGKATVERFRKSLSQYVSALQRPNESEEKECPPLVFIIDELDRCRPPYAIALLEKIKHLFNVPGLVFVLAIDHTQLGHSLRSVYGECMDIDGYLRRMIDFDYHLPTPKKGWYCKVLFTRYGLDDYFASRTHSEMAEDRSGLEQMLGDLFHLFSFSLRQQEQCFARLSVVCRLTGPQHLLFAYPLAVLMVLRMVDHNLYIKFIEGTVGHDAVIQKMISMPGGKQFLSEHIGIIAESCLIACMPTHVANETLKSYNEKIKVSTISPEEHDRLKVILSIVPRLGMRHGSPLKYIVDKIEVTQSFK